MNDYYLLAPRSFLNTRHIASGILDIVFTLWDLSFKRQTKHTYTDILKFTKHHTDPFQLKSNFIHRCIW